MAFIFIGIEDSSSQEREINRTIILERERESLSRTKIERQRDWESERLRERESKR